VLNAPVNCAALTPGGKRGLVNAKPVSRNCAALTVESFIMNTKQLLRSLVLAQALSFVAAFAAQAAPEDYAFKIISNALHPGDGAIISVSLTDMRTNTPVTDAVIFTTRLDMAPEGMEGMTTPVEAVASDIPGQYQFKADLTMAGNWRFQIAAKVQGEAETVQGELILGVQK
jgi:hypothetical protein